MKRLIYFVLVGVLTVGFMAAGTNRAEAMNNQSAVLLAGTFAVIGGAVLYAAALDADYHRPVYVESYPRVTYYREIVRPVRTEVIYVKSGHRDYFPRNERSNYRERHRDDRGQGRYYRRW